MKINRSIIIGFVGYLICYFYFAVSGAIVHNDTLAYMSFAKEFANGVFPKSSLYQPGVGFFILTISKILGTDFFISFRILNFLFGAGVVFLLNKFFAFDNNKLKNVTVFLIAICPFIAWASTFLYADIGFLFFSLLSLYTFTEYFRRNLVKYLLLSSFFTALTIFVKYNGLSVFVTIGIFLLLFGVVKKKWSVFKSIFFFAVFPVLYVAFWKIYNGNLGGVEFDSYIKTTDLNCILYYLKVNVISSYHLFLDTVFFSLHSQINHYFLIVSLLVFVGIIAFLFRESIKQVFKNLVSQNKFLLLVLFVVVYVCLMLALQSLNCLTEISIRIFLAPFIISYAIIVSSIVLLLANLRTGKSKFFFGLLLFLFTTLSLVKIVVLKEKDKQFFVSMSETENGQAIKFLSDKTIDIENSFATPAFRREYFLKAGEYQLLKTFVYQSYNSYDEQISYTNSEYLGLIKEKILSIPPNTVLIVELKKEFIAEFSDSLNLLSPVFKDDNVYIFGASTE